LFPDLSPSSGQPVLTIDLGAVQNNWRLMREGAHGARTAGVIKSNGYGCGALEIGQALVGAGCDLLFVATPDEGLELRSHSAFEGVTIAVLNGAPPDREKDFSNNSLVPVINDLNHYKSWMSLQHSEGQPLPFVIHIDTGMNRLGMSAGDAAAIAVDPEFAKSPPLFVMSHLACADTPDHEQNTQQRGAFASAAEPLKQIHPGLPLSLANSAGLYLGPDYCLDIVRPGIALYGGQPISGRRLPLEPVVHLHAPVLQVRDVAQGESVGYGATWKASGKSRIATVPLGYGDGILRAAGNAGHGFIGKIPVPMVGRVSMDLIALDVTQVPQNDVLPGTWVEILGENADIDQLGTAAGSFGYEILTGLGNRYSRRYVGPKAP
jgi:alanine racemase